jgi:hypothetical protein
LASHDRSFATMMCSLGGADLEVWMSAVDASDLPMLLFFAQGLHP